MNCIHGHPPATCTACNWPMPVPGVHPGEIFLEDLTYPEWRGVCECGAAKLGAKPYTPEHSDWCPVVGTPEKP